MKKLLLGSAILSTIIYANPITNDDLANELEKQKVTAPKTSTSGFMPQISLNIDASYKNISFDNEAESEHVEIPALVHGGGEEHEGHSHGTLAGEDGFKVNYAELAISASVDNYFDLMSIFHITQDDFEIEEAYISTKALPFNLKAKVGKFKSDFGYLNAKHHHAYNFADMPLIYTALLGDHGLTEEGFQLQYVLPTPFYAMAGVEILRGANELSYGYEGFREIEDKEFPSLFIGYLKTSFDLGGGTLLAGVSMANGKSKINHLEDEENAHAFDGETKIYGIDLTYKKYFSTHHAITLQGEYLYREMSGNRYVPLDDNAWRAIVPIEKKQGGFYAQLIYQYDKHFRAGLRYSAINQNDVLVRGIEQDIEDDIKVTSAMIEYNFSEMSRVRLQYNHNASLYDDEGNPNNKNELIIQFNYTIGAHGAHKF